MSTSDGKFWFLAQLKPNSHRIAERHLKRQSFEYFMPQLLVTTRVRGQFKKQHRPLFPGYLFVRFDPTQGHWRSVNSTQGVTRLVQSGSIPQTVPDAFMADLTARCDAEGVLVRDDALKHGDVVMLTQGPFADLVARVTSLTDEERVWVLLDILGRETKVAVARGSLRAL